MRLSDLSRPVSLLAILVAANFTFADEAARQKAEVKAEKLLKAANVDAADPKLGDPKATLSDWIATLNDWHAVHNKELSELWSQWSKARSVVPKDEFPGEVIAYKIDAIYDDLRPKYQAFIEKLSTQLSADQVDAVKEAWSRSPGNKRTYAAYLEIAGDLTEEQKAVVRDRLLKAREDAMLTDSDKEIVNIYKRHKVKVEQYIGSLEWQKLHKAFAEKGKKPATQKTE